MPFNIAAVEIAPDEMYEKSVDPAAAKKGALWEPVQSPTTSKKQQSQPLYNPPNPRVMA